MIKGVNTKWVRSEGWEHSEPNNTFTVVVKRVREGRKNLWYITAYVRPTHPLFPMFRNADPRGPAARLLGDYAGFTCLDVTEKMVAATFHFNKPWDSRFIYWETKEQAWELFETADKMIALLEELKEMGTLQMVKTLDGKVILAQVIEEKGEGNE